MLNEFPDIYYVQIFTMISINYRLVNVDGSDMGPQKKCFCLYLLKTRMYSLYMWWVFLKLFKAPVSI